MTAVFAGPLLRPYPFPSRDSPHGGLRRAWRRVWYAALPSRRCADFHARTSRVRRFVAVFPDGIGGRAGGDRPRLVSRRRSAAWLCCGPERRHGRRPAATRATGGVTRLGLSWPAASANIDRPLQNGRRLSGRPTRLRWLATRRGPVAAAARTGGITGTHRSIPGPDRYRAVKRGLACPKDGIQH